MPISFSNIKRIMGYLPDPNTSASSDCIIPGMPGEGGPFHFIRDFPIDGGTKKRLPAAWTYTDPVDMHGILEKCQKCGSKTFWQVVKQSSEKEKWPGGCKFSVICRACRSVHQI